MAAVSAAHKCAAAGWSVAVVDELPYGGTCALRGCDPKKILRRGAEIIDAAQLMQGKGIEEHGLRINWSDLVAHKRSFTEKMPDTIENGLEKTGSRRFMEPRALSITIRSRSRANAFPAAMSWWRPVPYHALWISPEPNT
ncbi:hypothetical protein [Salinisphaera hydrothermalis]|uniref:hypothetical protein n=1 Tax=Salinisphaera hydrothermalis TaxID=563188 RepID=UPI00333E3C4F